MFIENEEEDQGAHVFDLASLLEKGDADEKTKAENEFKEALEGKDKDRDYLGLEEEDDILEKPVLENKVEPIKSDLGLGDDLNDIKPKSAIDYKKLLIETFGNEIPTLIKEDEKGEDVEVSIEDLDIDEDTFKEIIQLRMDALKRESTEGKISVDSVSDFMKDLIEIDKNKGDISQLLVERQTYSDPLDNLDMTTPEGQRQAIFLKEVASGNEEDKVRRLIRSYEQDGVLEEEGLKAEASLRQALKARVEQVKKQAIKDREEFEKLIKSYKKDIRESLDAYELTDAIKNKVTILATKEENGKFEMDTYYFDMRKDPKEAADLALFLLDKQLFIKQVTNAKVQETKLKTGLKLGTISKGGAGTPVSLGQRRGSDKNEVVDLTGV